MVVRVTQELLAGPTDVVITKIYLRIVKRVATIVSPRSQPGNSNGILDTIASAVEGFESRMSEQAALLNRAMGESARWNSPLADSGGQCQIRLAQDEARR